MAEPGFRVNCGATTTPDPDDIEAAKRHTHDQVVEDLGPARTGPVMWRILPARQGLEVLAEHGWPDGEMFRFLRRHPGGRLVIAMAEFDPELLTVEQRAEWETSDA